MWAFFIFVIIYYYKLWTNFLSCKNRQRATEELRRYWSFSKYTMNYEMNFNFAIFKLFKNKNEFYWPFKGINIFIFLTSFAWYKISYVITFSTFKNQIFVLIWATTNEKSLIVINGSLYAICITKCIFAKFDYFFLINHKDISKLNWCFIS